MASEREHAQSEFMCIASRRKCVNIVVTSYLLYLLFQENKSFGAITICIHPLMYKKPCREHLVYDLSLRVALNEIFSNILVKKIFFKAFLTI